MKKSLLLASALLVGAITSQAAEARIYLHGGPEVLPENSMAIPVGDNDDPIVNHLYIWETDYTETPIPTISIPEGVSDAVVGEYMEFVVGNMGWWGVGYNAPKKFPAGITEATAGCDFSPVTYDWYFHFKMKTNIQQDNITIGLLPDLNPSNKTELVLNSGKSTIKTVTGEDPVYDGETWNEFKIPMSYFFDKFTSEAEAIDAFCTVHHDCNWLTFSGGNVEGKTIAFHDVYLCGEGIIDNGGEDTGDDTPIEDPVSDIYRIYMHGGPVELPSNSMTIPVGDNDDPIVNHLYIWETDYTETPIPTISIPEGVSDAVVGEYMEFVVGNMGWWGVGYNAPKKFPAGITEATAGCDFSPVTYDWYFHFKMKTNIQQDNITIGLLPDLNPSNKTELVLNSGKSTIKTVTGEDPVYDGETWNEFNIPMSYFFDKFTSEAEAIDAFCTIHHDCNWLTFSGGNVEGKKVAFHDVYLHNGMEVGAIDDVVVDQSSIEICGNVVKAEKAEIYNLQGIKVMEVDGEASIDALAKGVYVVRAANGDVVKIAR